MEPRGVVTHEQWLEARKKLLEQEKELTRMRDRVSAARRGLPWTRVEQRYAFDTPGGRKSLGQLFEGRSQLVVYHFMLGPGWEEGCPSCSFLCDHLDGALAHLADRDVSLVAVSRAPLPEIEDFRRRMGWRFRWVSSCGTDFNRDFGVTFTQDELADGRPHYNFGTLAPAGEEMPGLSVFFRDDGGAIFRTYSCYARGLDMLMGTYNILDMVPKGRDEAGLPWTMAWVRHHDRYADPVT